MDWFLYDNGLRHKRVKNVDNLVENENLMDMIIYDESNSMSDSIAQRNMK